MQKITPASYVLLVYLMSLNVLNFVDRQLLASFANFIKPGLGLSDTEFGLLTGFAFIVFYSLMGLFAGAIADLWHRPRIIFIGVSLWSLLTAASGLAKNFVQMLFPRMFIGIGESAMTPTSMSLLADHFPSERLGFVSGFYYIGVPVGVAVSMLVGGYLEPALRDWEILYAIPGYADLAPDQLGWRNCFLLLGIVGIFMAVVMLLVPERRNRQLPVGDRNTSPLASLRLMAHTGMTAMRSSRALRMTIAGGVCSHFILGAAAFDQLWFVQERGFDRTEILKISGLLFLIGGIPGNLCGGLLGDWWQKRFGSGRPMFLFWVTLVFTPVGLLYRLLDPASPLGEWLFYLCMTLGAFQLGAFYGPTFATVQELVPTNVRATLIAFYLLTLNLVGLGIGITLSGISIDLLRTGGFAEPYTLALLIFTVLSGLAMPLYYFAGKHFESDKQHLLSLFPQQGPETGQQS